MERLNTDISSIHTALQEAPEVLKSMGMNATIHIFDGTIGNLVRVLARQPLIRERRASVESRARFDVFLLLLEEELSSGWRRRRCEHCRRAQECP